ncbi:hypothetical protein LNQ52_17560 [Klebsiella pneumoniae subsp. pneumoniae]|nr:hypothetical protein [Klebsiella pneumoniae subsp. pneumoniae]
MGINEIIMYIMMFFMLIAAVDRILAAVRRLLARFLGKLGKSILRDPAVSLKKGLWRWARWAWRWSG